MKVSLLYALLITVCPINVTVHVGCNQCLEGAQLKKEIKTPKKIKYIAFLLMEDTERTEHGVKTEGKRGYKFALYCFQPLHRCNKD